MLDAEKTNSALLEVNNIEVIYNHVILVLKGVSLSVPKGGITALLGGNGAGKTTTLKAISNLLHSERGELTKGSVSYQGQEIQELNPSALVKRGVIQVMEGRHCFEHLTVEENLLTGAYTRRDGRAEIERDLEMVYNYFPRLKERRKSQAGYTSGGEQQMCAMGRALMSRPETILLDEPSMGLAPQLVEEIFAIVTALNEGEIITSVSFPVPEAANYQKFLQSASRFALVGVFVAKFADGVRVAVTGASEEGVFRWAEAEAALSADFTSAALDGLTLPADDMIGDVHGSKEYRAHLCGVMAKRAVDAAA